MNHMIAETEPLHVARPLRVVSSLWWMGLVFAASPTASAQDEGLDATDFEEEGTGVEVASADPRAPRLVLVGNDGSLCPAGTATFRASSDGGLTWKTSSNPTISTVDTKGNCKLEIDIIVPPNSTFRNPRFCPTIYAGMTRDALQTASQVNLQYTLSQDTSSGRKILGHENQPETIEPRRDLGLDGHYNQSPCKLVNMESKCTDPSQESVVRLSIDINAVVKPGAYLQLSALNAEFNEGRGVDWGTCDGFDP